MWILGATSPLLGIAGNSPTEMLRTSVPEILSSVRTAAKTRHSPFAGSLTFGTT